VRQLLRNTQPDDADVKLLPSVGPVNQLSLRKSSLAVNRPIDAGMVPIKLLYCNHLQQPQVRTGKQCA
jgi:hypothetical protein